jgi:hypothetical protein
MDELAEDVCVLAAAVLLGVALCVADADGFAELVTGLALALALALDVALALALGETSAAAA